MIDPPRIVAICGLPGVGKTTLIRALVSRFPDVQNPLPEGQPSSDVLSAAIETLLDRSPVKDLRSTELTRNMWALLRSLEVERRSLGMSGCVLLDRFHGDALFAAERLEQLGLAPDGYVEFVSALFDVNPDLVILLTASTEVRMMRQNTREESARSRAAIDRYERRLTPYYNDWIRNLGHPLVEIEVSEATPRETVSLAAEALAKHRNASP
jgi:thymidylate kinase